MSSPLKLWVPVVIGPLAWFTSLSCSFAAAPPACWAQTKLPLFLIPALALLATAAACGVSWRFSTHAGGLSERVLTHGGVFLNGFFIIVILAQFVAPSIYGACQ